GGRQAPAVGRSCCEKICREGQPGKPVGGGPRRRQAKTQKAPGLTRSQTVTLLAERELARASAWYEMVPRSQGTVPGRHGTFEDCIGRVPEIAALGFDVLYLTPIHPVGQTNRKGKNNSLDAGPDDPGSFYAIGNEHGGHNAV